MRSRAVEGRFTISANRVIPIASANRHCRFYGLGDKRPSWAMKPRDTNPETACSSGCRSPSATGCLANNIEEGSALLRKVRPVNRLSSRKCFVVDLENVVGGSDRNHDVPRVWNMLRPGIGSHDQVLVASGPQLARTALFDLKGENLRYHIRAGLDGAELELLRQLDEAHAARRFGTLVIISGDYRFAQMATRARSLGMRVWQVQGRGATSQVLWKASHVHARLRLEESGEVSAMTHARAA